MCGEKYAGMIEIADEVKEDSKVAIDLLRNYGVKKVYHAYRR